jgi:hypothetical protein
MQNVTYLDSLCSLIISHLILGRLEMSSEKITRSGKSTFCKFDLKLSIVQGFIKKEDIYIAQYLY